MAKNFALGTCCLLLVIYLQCTAAIGGASFQDRCEESRNVTIATATENRTEILPDTCNADQFLMCTPVSKICGCKDPANQIYGSKEFQVSERSRSRRSPKKGKVSVGKAVAAGAVAGVATYQLNKAVDHISQPSHGYSSSSSSGKKKTKTVSIKACYSRIGTKCAIDPDLTKQMSQTRTEVVNGSTTITKTDTLYVYRKEMSACVQNAECKPKTVRTTEDYDSNIGQCVCRDGYLHDPKSDDCVKVKRGGASQLKTEFSLWASILFVVCYIKNNIN